MAETIVRLLAVPPEDHDIDWLKQALQAAALLELSTIPPYLCGLWSIRSGDGPAFDLINSVVSEEMLHMGLACNLLTAVGGTPQIVEGYRANVKYPGSLPGGVHPDLTVYLAALSKEYVRNVYMEIEKPEQGSVVHFALAAEQFPTIGSFYDAILEAFNRLEPPLAGDRQLTSSIDGNDVFKITTPAEAARAISEIKEQGEGTSRTPFAADFGGGLAHFYRFGEIVAGKTVVPDPAGGFKFGGDPVPFPDVLPMAPVPVGGYANPSPPAAQALEAFNDRFALLLTSLQGAWEKGSQPDLKKAVSAMHGLVPLAGALMAIPLPDGNGVYGPEFRLPTAH